MLSFNTLKMFMLFAVAGILFLQLSCIERNNRWDPLNVKPEEPVYGCPADSTRYFEDLYNNQVTAILDSLTTIITKFTQDTAAFNSLQKANDSIRVSNNNIKKTIEEKLAVSLENYIRDTIAGNCETATPRDSIRLQLQLLDTNVSTVNITAANEMRIRDSSRIESLFLETEGICGELQIFPIVFRQSIRSSYTSTLNWDTVTANINQYAAAIADSNFSIAAINKEVRRHDATVLPYNDSLNTCKITRVTNRDTITEKLENITAGDTLAIDTGVYNIQIFLDSKTGETNRPIVIMGTPDGQTIFDQTSRVEILDSRFIKFEHIVFQRMNNDIGMRIINNSSNIEINHCIFRYNNQYGLDISNSTNISINNSIFTNNGRDTIGMTSTAILEQAGIRISRCLEVSLFNILVCNNKSYGIDITDSRLDLIQATVSDNLIDGVKYSSETQENNSCNISLSIFSYNGRYGIFCNNENSDLRVRPSSNRFYLNALSEMGGDSASVAANQTFISNIDPMYVNRENGYYLIGGNSLLSGSGIGYQYPSK